MHYGLLQVEKAEAESESESIVVIAVNRLHPIVCVGVEVGAVSEEHVVGIFD